MDGTLYCRNCHDRIVKESGGIALTNRARGMSVARKTIMNSLSPTAKKTSRKKLSTKKSSGKKSSAKKVSSKNKSGSGGDDDDDGDDDEDDDNNDDDEDDDAGDDNLTHVQRLTRKMQSKNNSAGSAAAQAAAAVRSAKRMNVRDMVAKANKKGTDDDDVSSGSKLTVFLHSRAMAAKVQAQQMAQINASLKEDQYDGGAEGELDIVVGTGKHGDVV
jgi:hypothetical protein